MKVNYDSEADVLIFLLSDNPPVDSVEESGGVIISYGIDGEPVTVEFLNASRHNILKSGELNITFQTKNSAAA
jgi:uncharacterized protein YuzE